MLHRIVERSTRGWTPRIRHPLLALSELIRAQSHPILVYQMSKVGSTSVCAALKGAGFRPLHVHYLGPMWEQVWEKYRNSPVTPPLHLSVERLLRPYLRWTSHRLKVVTLFRDPIDRHISSAFQTYDRDGFEVNEAGSTIDRLRDDILAGLGLDYCSEWFDRELRSVFKVDVLAAEFDKESGYSIVRGPRADILTLKLETLDRNWSTLAGFVGRPIEPNRMNVRSGQREAEIYREVRRRLRLPRRSVEKYYDHQWMRHFYTGQEIAALCQRWSEE